MSRERTYSYVVLIVHWVLHLLFLLFFIGILAVDMMEVAGDLGNVPPSLAAFMAFFFIALILEPLEMVLLSYRLLRPSIYLSFQIYKALLTTIFLIFAIYAYTKRGHDEPGIWKYLRIAIIAFSTSVLLSFYSSLVYAIIVFRKHRKSNAFDFDKERPRHDNDL